MAGGKIGQYVLAVMIPVDVVVTLWTWVGRGFVSEIGLNTLLFTVWGLPLVVMALAVKTVLAKKLAPSGLSPLAVALQVALWLSLVIFGATFTDVADPSTSGTEPYCSVFTVVVGWSEFALRLSNQMSDAAFLASAVSWIALSGVLVHEHRRAGHRRPQV